MRGVLATSTLSLVFTISAYVPMLTWLGVKTTEYLENKLPLELGSVAYIETIVLSSQLLSPQQNPLHTNKYIHNLHSFVNI